VVRQWYPNTSNPKMAPLASCCQFCSCSKSCAAQLNSAQRPAQLGSAQRPAQLSSPRLTSPRLGSAQLSSAQLSAQLSSAQLSAQLSSAHLTSPHPGSAWLSSAQLGPQLSSAQLSSAQLRSTHTLDLSTPPPPPRFNISEICRSMEVSSANDHVRRKISYPAWKM